ncbi:nucleoside-specific channel-forming Tsx family protein [Hydrogenophaga soli]
MKTPRLSLLAALLAAAVFSPAAMAQDWSFKNVSINHLDWSGKTERHTGTGPFGQKKDFTFLELEGGMGGKWGDVYGFFDIENPTNSPVENTVGKGRRIATKVVGRYNLTEAGGVPVQLYGHVYHFEEHGFRDENRVLGLGTTLGKGGYWIKPFVGLHQEDKTGLGAGLNGGMLGWVLGYSFKVGDQSFMLTNWHETEFGRKDKYLTVAKNGGVTTAKKTAQNGAVSLWWHLNPTVTLGATYRYADQKLGHGAYQDALIFTAKYNF